MKTVVDLETCIGCGLCVQIAPDVYKMEGDKAVAITAEVPKGKEEDAKSATEQCPVTAITVS